MSSNTDAGSIYTCRNHTTLRWFTTKPGGALVFMGALHLTEPPVLREPAYECGSPVVRMRRYCNNQNPYDPSQPLGTPFDYGRLKSYMKYVFKMEELGYVFECECSAGELITVPNETYESLDALRTRSTPR